MKAIIYVMNLYIFNVSATYLLSRVEPLNIQALAKLVETTRDGEVPDRIGALAGLTVCASL
jgi:hypothetical protein